MKDIWLYYRCILGAFVLFYLLPLGCVLINFGVQLTHQIGATLERQSRDWNKEIGSEVLSMNRSVQELTEEMALNNTSKMNLTWPPIPLKSSPDKTYAWPMFTPNLFIGLGLFTILLSLLGTFTVYNKTPLFIVLFTVLMTIFVLIQILFAFLHFSIDSNPLQNMRDELKASLQDEYEMGAEAHNQFTFSLNTVMLAWNCCGIAGPADFLAKEYSYKWSYSDRVTDNGGPEREKSGSTKNGKDGANFYRRVKFPLACCKLETRERGFEALLDCAASGDEKLINNKGCFPIVFENLFRNVGDEAVDAVVYIIGFEVLLIILVTVLANMPRDYETDATQLAIEFAHTITSQTQALIDQAIEENEAMLDTMEEIVMMSGDQDTQDKKARGRRHVFVPHAKIPSESEGSGVSGQKIVTTQIW